MGLLTLIGQLAYFFLPAGLANMSPVLFKNRFKQLAVPVDGGSTFMGQPLFGSHKTWRGIIIAPIMGEVLFLVQLWLASAVPATVQWSIVELQSLPWWFGFLIGGGAIVGDLIKSFFKRRVSVKPGKTWFPFDQIDFLLGAGIVALPFVDLTTQMWLIIILVGPVLHILVNRIGFWMKLKDTPW